MIYGLILSAGNQSRFKKHLPKALMKINGTPLLDINMLHMKKVCDVVYVVTSRKNSFRFTGYDQLVIDSGLGCGDAVMKALKQLPLTEADTVFIQWGDCLHKEFIYPALQQAYSGSWILPCVREDHPYVEVIPQKDSTVKVLFSKYDEAVSDSGLHDLSLFYGNAIELLNHLVLYADMIGVENGYKHIHGNEMLFLDVFNETSIPAHVVEFDNYFSASFNTVEEFESYLTTQTIQVE